VLAAVTVRVGI